MIPCFSNKSRLLLSVWARHSKSLIATFIPLPRCLIFLPHSSSMSTQTSYSILWSFIFEHMYFIYIDNLLKSCSLGSSLIQSCNLNAIGSSVMFWDKTLTFSSFSLMYWGSSKLNPFSKKSSASTPLSMDKFSIDSQGFVAYSRSKVSKVLLV